MRNFTLLFVCALLSVTPLAAQQSNQTIRLNGFIENKGQLVDQTYKPNPTVKYLLCHNGFNIQLRQTGFSYDTYTEEKDTTSSVLKQSITLHSKFTLPEKKLRLYHRVDIQLVNCNLNAQIVASGKSETYFNYFTTGTPEGGNSYVYSYNKVVYKNIYPNIDLEFCVTPSVNKGPNKAVGMEYQFILHPGANANDIKLKYEGANDITLNDNQLKVGVKGGHFTEKIPSSYFRSDNKQIEVKYTDVGNNTFSFELPNKTLITSDLIIDPTPCLDWGTFYTGGGAFVNALALDPQNNVYITGYTASATNIATAGAYQTVFGGYEDIIVAEFNSTGSKLLWATYYGGNSDEAGLGIAVDSAGNSYITGWTASGTNISTPGSFQPTDVAFSAFVSKFNSTGTKLLWGTYYNGTVNFGGPGGSTGTGIVLDRATNVYVTGYTSSLYGMTTSGAYQTTNASQGGDNAFVAKFNPTGSKLLWGTYYGGSNSDEAYAIAIDSTSNVYITGWASSTNNVATGGAYQTSLNGNTDAFVAKINSTGSKLLWGSYYGGTEYDYSYAIALDATNNVYITGYTESPTNISTPGAYQTVFSGYSCAILAKFNSTGSKLLWGTYFGNLLGNTGWGVAVDKWNNPYITGNTQSITGISTVGAYQTNFMGVKNGTAYVAKFNPIGSSLLWGTYFGDTVSGSTAIVLDTSENVYICGNADTGYITTAGAYNRVSGGAYVAKFSCNPVCNVSEVSISASKSTICKGDTVLLSVTGGENYYTYTWSPGGQTSTSIQVTPTATVTDTLTVSNPILYGCTNIITSEIVVNPLPIPIIKGKDSICIGSSTTLIANGGTSYVWNTGATASNITVTPLQTTTYTLQAKKNGCTKDTDITILVDTIKPIPNVSPPQIICYGDSVKLTASGGASYNWSPSAGLSSSSISNPIAFPAKTTTYTITVFLGICSTNDSINVKVTQLPSIVLSNIDSVCFGDSIKVTASGGAGYLWNTGATTDSIYVKPLANTKYAIQVSANGCIKDSSLFITVSPSPNPSISGEQVICSGASSLLSASGGNSYLWSTGATTSNITVFPSATTQYYINEFIGSCSARDSIRVLVNSLPAGSVCCDTTINGGTSIKLNATGGSTYSWSPSIGLSCNSCNDPRASPLQSTTYTISIISDSGCVSYNEVTIDVTCDVFVPKAFSPNNDGQNDELYIRGDCIKTLDFMVFDRWGNKVFETTDKSIPWDGRYKGEQMNTGSYVYYLTATLYDGSSIQKKGDVTLVR